MPEVHYTDAILTILFGSGVAFMLWSLREFMAINKRFSHHETMLREHALKSDLRLAKMEKRILKKIKLANENGANFVAEKFGELIAKAGR